MKISQRQINKLKTNFGPWAIVTGASSGIGEKLAEGLAQANLNLVVAARSEDKLLALAQRLQSEHEIEFKIVATDLSTQEGMDLLEEKTKELEIGLVVCNAGFATSGPLIDNLFTDELEMFMLNSVAPLRAAHHFGARMATQKRGALVFISSILGFQGSPFSANYGASKAYIQSLAEGIAAELDPRGVQVLVAAPGPVSTGFGERAQLDMGNAQNPSSIAQEIIESIGKRTVVVPGRMSKILNSSLSILPRKMRVKAMTQIMRKMVKA